MSWASACRIVEAVKSFVSIGSVIDIGCGVGQNLKAFSEAGAEFVRGVDGSWVNKELLMIPSESFTQADLSQPGLSGKIPEKHFDLTISTEVAEHIDPENAENFMDNLVSFSDVILFSAAIPGQGGTHHVNEQWPSYWIEKFAARGFVPADCIRSMLWNCKDVHSWYKQNLMFFVRKTCLDKYPLLQDEAERPVLEAVHPDVWTNKLNSGKVSNMGFWVLCKVIAGGIVYLVPAFIRAVKKRVKKRLKA